MFGRVFMSLYDEQSEKMTFDVAKGGPGYPPVFREHALAFLDHIDGDSKNKRVSQAAEAFSVSTSSIYRWAARQAETGNNVENKAHAGQQRRVLDGEGDVLLMLYMGTRHFVWVKCV
jgi:hypothetical protein